MATTTIDNTTVVFSNSTAAANLSTSISESASSYVYNFDVLAYSGGGAKTTIWSVDDGVKGDDNPVVVVSSAFSGYNTDLLYKDAANSWETSSLGAKFAIVNGKIQYDASGLSTQINHLGVGESLNDSLQYTIRMSNGTLSVGTLKVALTGTNDAVVLDHATGGATTDEDAGTASTGTINFTDADTNDIHSASYTAGSGNLGLGSFSLGTLSETHVSGSDAAGSVGWSYTVNNSAAQYLHGDEHVDETFTVKIDDGHGGEAYQTVTVRINGVNDEATITAGEDDDNDVTEAGNAVAGDPDAGGKLVISDADHDQNFLDADSTGEQAGTYGTFTVGADGTWSYVLDDGAADELAAGATKYDTITVTSLDGTATHEITVTIHGTNDAPVITNGAASYAIDENTTGVIYDFDASDVDTVDTADTLTWSLAGADKDAFSIDSSGKLSLIAQQDYETTTSLSVTVQVSDGHGGSATKDITININDVNEVVPFTPPTLATVTTGGGDDTDNNGTGGGNNASTISGTTGADTIKGGSADQTINGGDGNDTIYARQGDDTVNGGNGDDLIYGANGNDHLNGDAGNDTIYGGSGADVINGGADNDSISGGFGADTLTGGSGNDKFFYLDLRDSGDHITDFTAPGDKIDVSAVDANGALGGNQAFAWGGENTATANGIWWHTDGTNTTIYGDTDGITTTAEFWIVLDNVTSVSQSDFVL